MENNINLKMEDYIRLKSKTKITRRWNDYKYEYETPYGIMEFNHDVDSIKLTNTSIEPYHKLNIRFGHHFTVSTTLNITSDFSPFGLICHEDECDGQYGYASNMYEGHKNYFEISWNSDKDYNIIYEKFIINKKYEKMINDILEESDGEEEDVEEDVEPKKKGKGEKYDKDKKTRIWYWDRKYTILSKKLADAITSDLGEQLFTKLLVSLDIENHYGDPDIKSEYVDLTTFENIPKHTLLDIYDEIRDNIGKILRNIRGSIRCIIY